MFPPRSAPPPPPPPKDVLIGSPTNVGAPTISTTRCIETEPCFLPLSFLPFPPPPRPPVRSTHHRAGLCCRLPGRDSLPHFLQRIWDGRESSAWGHHQRHLHTFCQQLGELHLATMVNTNTSFNDGRCIAFILEIMTIKKKRENVS